MRKVIGLVIGIISGLLGGIVVNSICGRILCSFINCFRDSENKLNENKSGITFIVICVIVCAIIGFVIGKNSDDEALLEKNRSYKEKLEEEHREERRKLNEWSRDLYNNFITIESFSFYTEIKNTYKIINEYKEQLNKWETSVNEKYDIIWKYKESAYNNKVAINYKKEFDNSLIKHKENMHCLIKSILQLLKNNHVEMTIGKDYNHKLILSKNFEIYDTKVHLEELFIYLLCLKNACMNDSKYNPVILEVKKLLTYLSNNRFYGISENYTYGDMNFTENIKYFNSENVKDYEQKLHDISVELENNNLYYSGITQNLNLNLILYSCGLMWYYAKKVPFNNEKFKEYCNCFNIYTATFRSIDIEVCEYDYKLEFDIRTSMIYAGIHVEALLAEIYSKNQIGGAEAVQQMNEKINEWLYISDKNKEKHQEPRCYEMLASGLAWMELYNLELKVLHVMLQKGLQMSENVQERLKFLESGGTSNVKIYEVSPEKDFIYDSSSENWNANEFNVFFRKVGMKKLKINYSLTISSWKKTLPLSNHQKVSMNDIFSEFQDMIIDFDGEVTCSRTQAKAIDLDNVNFNDSVVFHFTSERNKCLTMLFACEKFGRNLNITILTLFTPENNMDIEKMQKYATAIKSNIYVDSFKETILQAVDEIIKEEKTLYDEDEPSLNNKFME